MTAAGPSLPPPCGDGIYHMAVSSLGIACLVPSDPNCGQQFDEPPDCTYKLEMLDADGLPNVVLEATHLRRCRRARRRRPRRLDGLRRQPPGQARGARRHAVGAGYLVTFVAGVDSPRLYRWPMRMLLAPDGSLLSPAVPVEPMRDDLPFQDAPLAVGVSDDGVSLVWEASQDTEFYPSAMLFRDLGCLP